MDFDHPFRLACRLLYEDFWKLARLNALLLLFSLPVVTLFPALAAGTTVLTRLAEERPVELWPDFWDAFRKCFWQGLGAGLLTAVFFLCGGVGLHFYREAGARLPQIVVAALLLTGAGAACYLLPMVGRIKLPLSKQLKNALLLSVTALPKPLLLLGGTGLWWLACLTLGLPGLLAFFLTGLSGPLCFVACGSGREIQAHVLGRANGDSACPSGKHYPCNESE